jgi:hypothetical protein
LVVCVYVMGVCAAIWLGSIIGARENLIEGALIYIGFGAFAVVGALLVAKRPANVVGWILVAVSLVVPVHVGEFYAAYMMTTGREPGLLVIFGAWINAWYWYLTLALAFLFLPLLFPDGRLISRRWLLFATPPGLGVVGAVVLGALTQTLTGTETGYRIENPIGIDGLGNVEELPVFGALGILFTIGGIGAVASVVVRFRRSRGIERQQMKWFLYAAAPIPAILVTDYVPGIFSELVFVWVLISLPTAIGIAILRYRLYDIDVIINRTLVYGVLTVTFVLVYLGSVVTLQAVFRTLTGQSSDLAVVASTLAIAALFSPLRRRVQSFVDRRFYRRKYDASKILEAFATRLRNETELEALDSELKGVVLETVQPEHVGLWLREPGGGAPGESVKEREV